MKPPGRRRNTSWDLRVACALISLDIVVPFLNDLGFDTDVSEAARVAARKYLAGWRTRAFEDQEVWLTSVREQLGDSVAKPIAQLSEALAIPHMRFSWFGVLLNIRDGKPLDPPRISPRKWEWFKAAARTYLAGSDAIDLRADGLLAPVSEWDVALLTENFYPGDGDEDPDSRRFDPRSWLWAYLEKLHRERFQEQLRLNLSSKELNELVAWRDSVAG